MCGGGGGGGDFSHACILMNQYFVDKYKCKKMLKLTSIFEW